MNKKRQPISPADRFDVFKRDGFACRYCGAKPPEVSLEIDHITPVARGGTNDPGNLATACMRCNVGKFDVPLDEGPKLRKGTRPIRRDIEPRRKRGRPKKADEDKVVKMGESVEPRTAVLVKALADSQDLSQGKVVTMAVNALADSLGFELEKYLKEASKTP